VYSVGELNRLIDALIHPLAKRYPEFLILDATIHGVIEKNPPESTLKFMQYNLPKLVAELLRKRKSL
jgi:hypothetical protein